MLSFHNLLESFDINPKTVRLVRHGYKELDPLEVFLRNPERLHEYSSWQARNKFGDSKYLAMFAPAKGTTALFLGL
jgi:hypothetical protein